MENKLSKLKEKFLIGSTFYNFFFLGYLVILIGAILPMMAKEYNLSYNISGMMLSAHNIGQMITGFIAGILAIRFGIKRSMIAMNLLTLAGFAVTLFTGNPIILVASLLLTGFGRGSGTNYSNQIISESSEKPASLLNALHAFFAIGALVSPVIVLLCTRNTVGGWRYTIYVLLALGILSTIFSSRADMSNISISKSSNEKPSYKFFKNKTYIITTLIAFLYTSVESVIMGLLVTFFTDTGVVSDSFAQLLTSLLWITILAGRFTCTALVGKIKPEKIIRLLSGGMIIFLALLVISKGLPMMLVATIGLGLSMSGMYATTVANTGDIFTRYPMAMSMYVTLTSLGAVIAPAIVGVISQSINIRTGIAVMLIPDIAMFVLTVINCRMKKLSK